MRVTELLSEPHGTAEDATKRHVLAKDNCPFVRLERGPERVVHSLKQVEFLGVAFRIMVSGLGLLLGFSLRVRVTLRVLSWG
jgi:hypothetical protein